MRGCKVRTVQIHAQESKAHVSFGRATGYSVCLYGSLWGPPLVQPRCRGVDISPLKAPLPAYHGIVFLLKIIHLRTSIAFVALQAVTFEMSLCRDKSSLSSKRAHFHLAAHDKNFLRMNGAVQGLTPRTKRIDNGIRQAPI